MFRTILVDDQPIFRDIIRGVLARTGRFQFVGEAENGADLADDLLPVGDQPRLRVLRYLRDHSCGHAGRARERDESPSRGRDPVGAGEHRRAVDVADVPGDFTVGRVAL